MAGAPAAGAGSPELTEAQLLWVLEHGAELKRWVDDVTVYANREAAAGRDFEGFAVRERRTNRQFVEPSRAAEVLLSQCERDGIDADLLWSNRKLRSPA